MKHIFLYILILFPVFLSAQTLRKLKIKEIKLPEIQRIVKNCDNPGVNYIVFSTAIRNLKFTGNRVLNVDSTYTNRYVICLREDIKTNARITISGSKYKEIRQQSFMRNHWYEIQPKKTFKEIMTPQNNHLAILLGKGFSYSPIGGGIGTSVLWRFGNKVGLGLQAGVGYYSIYTNEHLGNQVISGSYTIDNNKNKYLHWSIGLKCYPLMFINPKNEILNGLIDGVFLYSSYGTLGTFEVEAYNYLNGSFSLGGMKTQYGFSIMLGEDWYFPVGSKKTSGIIANVGLGTAHNITEKNWKFAYDFAVGWCFKLSRKK
jgi:hypothetical protein